MTQQEVHDLIREHGGIVHGDGNIFFTNAVQFGLAVAAMKPEPSQEYAELVLASLDALKDDAAVHIFPSDLHKCETSECVVKVCSVRVGSPDENSEPLFSRAQVAVALADATHTLRMGGAPC